MGFIQTIKDEKIPTNFFSNKELEERDSKLLANIEKKVRESFNQELRSLRHETDIDVNDIHTDPFYSDIFEEYEPQDLSKEEKKRIEESVNFMRSQGFITRGGAVQVRDQADEIREYIQDAAYIQTREDPHVGSIVNQSTQYIIGRGIKFRVKHPKVQAVLDEFWRENEMELKQKELVWRAEIESESFIVIFDEDGKSFIREIPPAQITDVEQHSDDNWINLSYKREYMKSVQKGINVEGTGNTQYYPAIGYEEQKSLPHGEDSKYENTEEWMDDAHVLYIRLGKNREKRSWVNLQKVLKWARYYRNWLKDRIVLNHERSRVIWLKKVNSAEPDAQTRYQRAPSAGYMLVESQNVEYTPVNANINADDVKEDGLAIMYAVAAGSGIPLHILQQRSNEQVYSSLKEGVIPFNQQIIDRQDLWAENFKKIFRHVIKKAADAEQIPTSVIVTTYVNSIVRESWRRQVTLHKQGKVSDTEVVHFAESVLKKFKEQVIDNSDQYTTQIAEQVQSACSSLVNKCNVVASGVSQFGQENTLESTRIWESDGEYKIANTSTRGTSGLDVMDEVNTIMEQGIRTKVKANQIPIEIVFPDIAKEDELKSAKVLEKHAQMQLASRTTLANKAGYNWNEEAALIKQENEILGIPDQREQMNQTNQNQDEGQESAGGKVDDDGNETDTEEGEE